MSSVHERVVFALHHRRFIPGRSRRNAVFETLLLRLHEIFVNLGNCQSEIRRKIIDPLNSKNAS